MKKGEILILAAVLLSSGLYAQNNKKSIPEGYELLDTIIYRPAATLDSAIVGKPIFAYIDADLDQDNAITEGMSLHLKNNSTKTLSGFRVRIFFDNSQNARNASAEALSRFQKLHPEIPAYRSYLNPYFKVTVGDFRTKSEALQMFQSIVKEFPSAFLVKENINYPAVDRKDAFVTDTLHFIRKKKE